jgi:tripartite-type tricarboxylate transporter receptor subunit TctC
VVKSPADGYTIGLVATGPVAGMPALSKVPYKQSDIEYITLAAHSSAVIVVNSKSSYDSLASLVRAGKAAPNALNYGSAGNATTPHIGGALFAQEAGFEATHVPYKGTAPSITALMAGEIQFLSTDIMAVMGSMALARTKGPAKAVSTVAAEIVDIVDDNARRGMWRPAEPA